MKLDNDTRNLISACFGLDAEAYTPEKLAKAVASCDTATVRKADKESIIGLNRFLDDAGISIWVVDCSAVEFPEGLPIEVYVTKDNNRSLAIYVPNPAQEYGTQARFFFPDPREARCEALKLATAIYLHPEGDYASARRYEYIANRIDIHIQKDKQWLLDTLRKDLAEKSGLFGGLIRLRRTAACA